MPVLRKRCQRKCLECFELPNGRHCRCFPERHACHGSLILLELSLRISKQLLGAQVALGQRVFIKSPNMQPTLHSRSGYISHRSHRLCGSLDVLIQSVDVGLICELYFIDINNIMNRENSMIRAAAPTRLYYIRRYESLQLACICMHDMSRSRNGSYLRQVADVSLEI